MFIAFLSAGNILAQDLPVADSLNVVAVGDSVAIDSTAIAGQPQKEPPFKSRVTYKAADSVQFLIPAQRAFLYNEGQVNYENIELKAYETEFDMTTKIVYAKSGKDSIGQDTGLPVLKQGEEVIDAYALSYNFSNSKGVIHQLKSQQGEGYMHAEKAKRYSDGHIDMAHGKYTTCDADHPHFYLALSKAKMIPGDQVVFGPTHLVLLDIPLPLVIPFGFFPYSNKQAVSGILPPTIGVEAVRGLSLTNGGYYFAFSDHFDATVMGDIYSSGTWKTNLTTRYMARYKYTGNLNFNYGVNVSGEKGLDQTKEKLYSIMWTHSQDAKAHPNRTFSASVNYSSSSYNREFNYTNPQDLYTNTKQSSISYRQGWPNSPFNLSVNMNHSQSSIDSTVNIKFPDVAFSMGRIYPFRKKESTGKAKWYEDIALSYDANMQNTLNGKEDNLFSEKNINSMKNGFQHRIPFSINFKVLKIFNVTPSLNYNGVLYTSRIKKYYDRDSTGTGQGPLVTDTIRGLSYGHALAPSLSLSANPKFYLMNTYGPESKVEAIRTVISPSVGVSYVPDLSGLFKNHDSYRDSTGLEHTYSKYEGYIYGTPSAPGQAGSVSVGLNGNVEMKVRTPDDTTGVSSRKVKIIDRIDARSSYNMFADSMNWSNISLSASTTILGINLNFSGTVDPYKLTPAGIRVNQFGPRLTSLSFNTGISLPLAKKEGEKEEGEKDADDDGYSYFNIPWSVSFNYSFSYNKPVFDGAFTQNLSFSGNIALTPKWSINFQSAYDFEAKQISYTTVSIQRDLHCWAMSFNCAPFGVAKYFFFQINVKSALLQDLKWEKRKSQYDYTQW